MARRLQPTRMHALMRPCQPTLACCVMVRPGRCALYISALAGSSPVTLESRSRSLLTRWQKFLLKTPPRKVGLLLRRRRLLGSAPLKMVSLLLN
jgi:hypothetical protein